MEIYEVVTTEHVEVGAFTEAFEFVYVWVVVLFDEERELVRKKGRYSSYAGRVNLRGNNKNTRRLSLLAFCCFPPRGGWAPRVAPHRLIASLYVRPRGHYWRSCTSVARLRSSSLRRHSNMRFRIVLWIGLGLLLRGGGGVASCMEVRRRRGSGEKIFRCGG